MAPLDCVAQRILLIAAAGEERQSLLSQPRQDLLGRQELDACGRKLDRERDPRRAAGRSRPPSLRLASVSSKLGFASWARSAKSRTAAESAAASPPPADTSSSWTVRSGARRGCSSPVRLVASTLEPRLRRTDLGARSVAARKARFRSRRAGAARRPPRAARRSRSRATGPASGVPPSTLAIAEPTSCGSSTGERSTR